MHLANKKMVFSSAFLKPYVHKADNEGNVLFNDALR